MNTVRTTLMMPPALLERLKLFSRHQGKSMSEVVEEGVRHVLDEHEDDRLERTYQGLLALKGMIKEPITDASTTIDETLYGENGAWKGQRE